MAERKSDFQVIIAGGGPTGLMLAGELALARVDVVVIEKRASAGLAGLRAGGLHIRTIEVLDQRGISGRFLVQGKTSLAIPFARATLDTSDQPTRHNYFLALWQTRVEQTLAEWVCELGVPIWRGCDVADFAQDESGVNVALSNGRTVRARYLAGCDGGRSAIRKKAGIAFDGHDATTSWLIAEVQTTETPEWGVRGGPNGINAIAKLEGDTHARMVLNEKGICEGDPALEDVRQALLALYGRDFGLRSARYISRFTDMTRQAASYWNGRVLLAGDAAHVHAPIGGQGLNLGLQDAVNLGWKLAQVVHGVSPATLLATYHAERHPVGARVLRNTMALAVMERDEHRTAALREMLVEVLRNDAARAAYVAMASGLDIRYDCGEGHPLLGRRMPDFDLQTANGDTRVFAQLHEARPVLLNLEPAAVFDVGPWAGRVRQFSARYNGEWRLPVIGRVEPAGAVLVRPDGYVAWVAEQGQEELEEALAHWFGPQLFGFSENCD